MVMNRSTTTDEQNVSMKSAWVLLIVCAVLEIAAVGAFVWELRDPTRPDLGLFYVVICTAMGLLTAAATFGVLKSFGRIRGKNFNAVWEFGGPAAVVIFFLLVGVHLATRPEPAFDVIVDFQENGEPLPRGGIVLLFTAAPNEPQSVHINNGRAIFQLPTEFRGKPCHYHTEIEGYHVDKPKTLTLVPGTPVIVEMKPDITHTMEVPEKKFGMTVSIVGPPGLPPVEGTLEVRSPSLLRVPIHSSQAKLEGIPLSEAGKQYSILVTGAAGYEAEPGATITLQTEPTVVTLRRVPPPPQEPVPVVWKLIWLNHFEPGRLYEVVNPDISTESVNNDTFKTWCVPFDEGQYEVLERVIVAKDEHWQVPSVWLSEHKLPMLNERWFQIMDDEVWYAFRLRRRY
jgi:hypothetical protein